MKAPVFKTYLYVSIALLVLVGAAYIFNYRNQLQEREAVFNIHIAIDDIYQIQIIESKLSGEAYHFASTGQEHNRVSYRNTKSSLESIIDNLKSTNLVEELMQDRDQLINALLSKTGRLDSLMERPFF